MLAATSNAWCGAELSAPSAAVPKTPAPAGVFRVVALPAEEKVSQLARKYLNRLSDLMFVLARALSGAGGSPDILWQKGRARGTPRA